MDDIRTMNATDETLTRRRWLILAVICLINLCAGSIYAWSVLASAAAGPMPMLVLAIDAA